MVAARDMLLMAGGIVGLVAALMGSSGLPNEGSAQVLVALGAIVALMLVRAPRTGGDQS